MSAKPDRTLVTAQDVFESLTNLHWDRRFYRIENDFQFGYESALNDVRYHLFYASRCTCDECVVAGQTLATVEDVLDFLFCKIQFMQENPPEDDFQQGYQKALNAVMHQVWLASPESAKSEYAPQKMPESCTEGANVIDLADACRTMETKAPRAARRDDGGSTSWSHCHS